MPKGILLTEEAITQRRQEIAGAARELFLKNGYHETSMRQIAIAVRAGKSTLYDYFTTKDEILIYILDLYIGELIARAEKVTHQHNGAIEKLKLLMSNHMQYLFDTQQLLWMLTIEVQRLGVLGQQRFREKRLVYQNLVADAIQDAVQKELFRPIDSQLAANMVLAVSGPSVLTGIPPKDAQATIDEIIHTFMHGVMT